MRPFFLLFVFWSLPLWASASEGPLSFHLSGTIDLPGQGWQSAYSSGWGGSMGVVYTLDRDWSFRFDVDELYFSGQSPYGAVSDDELRLVPAVQFYLSPDPGLRPYLFTGSGLDIQFLGGSAGPSSATSWLVAAGLGFEWQLQSEVWVFIEGEWNLLIADGPRNTVVTGQDVPLSAGIRFGL